MGSCCLHMYLALHLWSAYQSHYYMLLPLYPNDLRACNSDLVRIIITYPSTPSNDKGFDMPNPFIRVNVILPSQEKMSLTFNTRHVVFFRPSSGDYTELVMIRGTFIVDMPYDEFKELSKLND